MRRKSGPWQAAAHGLEFGLALMLLSCTSSDPPSLVGTAADPPRAASLLPTPPQPVSGPVGTPIGLRPPDASQTYAGNAPLIRAAAPRSAAATTDAQGDVVINFANADVREVARAVLGEILHLNYVVDPRLQATITMQTGQPLPRAAVLPALDSVLRASGAALMETDGVWRVVPADEAPKTGGSSLAINASRPGFGIQVLPLRYVSAAEMRRTLEPFIPAGGVVEIDAVRNLLLVSGSREDRENFTEIVRLFDVDWLKGMSFGLYPLKIGRARQVADELESVFGAAEGPLAGVLRIVPIERLNAILAISSQASYLREARTWVDRLDYGDDQTTPRFFQYYVQNSRATDLAGVLNDLISSAGTGRSALPETAPGSPPSELQSASARAPTGTQPGEAAAPAGSQMSGASGGALPPPGLTPAPTTSGGAGALGGPGQLSQSRTRRPGSGARGGAAAALRGLRGGGPTGARETEEPLETPDIHIVADDKNNVLVVYARPRDYRLVEDLIRNLDIVPLQVLIEATIAEVTLNDTLQYGLQYFLKSGNSRFIFSAPNTTTGANVSTGTNTTTTSSANVTPGVNSTSNLGTSTAANFLSVLPGFNYVLAAGSSSLILSALSSLTNVNVVSSPQLLVLDHQTAFLQVGDQVPVPVQSAVSVLTPGAPVVNSITFRDTGVILQVTPRVNTTGLVTMEVEQEVSDVVRTTSSNIDSPTIEQRRITSTVVVQDGQTIALGGLIKDNHDTERSGLPVLSDLPVVGALFRNTTKSRARTELLVLLTPSVVRSPEQARIITQELRERMQNVRPLGYRIQ